MSEDVGARLNEEVAKICAEVPERLNIVGILRDAHARLTKVAGDIAPSLPPELIMQQVVEVMREIASHAVGEFESRTGQQFLWVDEPDEPDETLMSIGIEVKDGKATPTF